jgi:hypothetical protein
MDKLSGKLPAHEKIPSYKKPSAKAPVIHPGDEAPFLVREVRGKYQTA